MRTQDTGFIIAATKNWYAWCFRANFEDDGEMWKSAPARSMGKDLFARVFAQVKILSLKCYIRVQLPGDQYNAGTSPEPEKQDVIIHTAYDPDADGRELKSLDDFYKFASSKRRVVKDLRKEYAFTLYPKWARYFGNDTPTSPGFEALAPTYNPWFDTWAFGPIKQDNTPTNRPRHSLNGLHIGVQGASGLQLYVRYQWVLGYRQLRQGVEYDEPEVTTMTPIHEFECINID